MVVSTCCSSFFCSLLGADTILFEVSTPDSICKSGDACLLDSLVCLMLLSVAISFLSAVELFFLTTPGFVVACIEVLLELLVFDFFFFLGDFFLSNSGMAATL